jgi:hypothetical protein
MNRKPSTPIDDDRLTPEEERSLAFAVAQGKAGLSYGPFEKGRLSLRAFMKARERTRRVSIRVPAILHEYLQTEANRFGMTSGDLIATILQIHKFKDQDRQLILLAIGAVTSGKKTRGPLKSKKL